MKYTVTYDGTFAGFLTAVFEVYDRKVASAIIRKNNGINSLPFENIIATETSEEKAIRVLKGFRKKVSSRSAFNFYGAFLSEIDGIETTLLSFMQYVFSNEKKVDSNLGHPDILRVAKISRMVHREKHRMEAFTRFQLTVDGIYFALIHPDFNVLPLISPHFTQRYADQRWMIYDEKRRYALYYNLEKTMAVEVEFSEEIPNGKLTPQQTDVNEAMYERLWRAYFKNVNIPSRKNLKLHLRHVPLRYWKYLTEKQPELMRTSFANTVPVSSPAVLRSSTSGKHV